MIKAVIFDMDGVIIDSNPHHLITWRQYLAQNGVSASDQELKDHMYGKNNTYICRHFFGQDLSKETIERMQYEKEALFREIFEPVSVCLAGFEEFLTDLLSQNMKTGIATSAPFLNLDLTLRTIPITQKIHVKLSEEDVTQHKPHPEVYLKAADLLGVAPADCVVFEDSYSGATAAIHAGMKVVGVLTTYTASELPPCNAYIEDFGQLTTQDLAKL